MITDFFYDLDQFFKGRKLTKIFVTVVDENQVAQLHYTSNDLPADFSLTIHEDPTVSILVAFVKEHIYLSVWKDIFITGVERGLSRGHTWLCNHIWDLWLSTRESSLISDSKAKGTHTFINSIDGEYKLWVVNHLVSLASERILAVHDKGYCLIHTKIVVKTCSEAHISWLKQKWNKESLWDIHAWNHSFKLDIIVLDVFFT